MPPPHLLIKSIQSNKEIMNNSNMINNISSNGRCHNSSQLNYSNNKYNNKQQSCSSNCSSPTICKYSSNYNMLNHNTPNIHNIHNIPNTYDIKNNSLLHELKDHKNSLSKLINTMKKKKMVKKPKLIKKIMKKCKKSKTIKPVHTYMPEENHEDETCSHSTSCMNDTSLHTKKYKSHNDNVKWLDNHEVHDNCEKSHCHVNNSNSSISNTNTHEKGWNYLPKEIKKAEKCHKKKIKKKSITKGKCSPTGYVSPGFSSNMLEFEQIS